ncbi:SAM-dependent methyltransferase [Streptomyces kronopolitis]|uniref:SAM-dependent methyltransferase n=1 Tax=Streptomyces kronopolitis TaxID=1612435 RepID=UPI00367F6584
MRALETERENTLLRNPLAHAFAAGGLWPPRHHPTTTPPHTTDRPRRSPPPSGRSSSTTYYGRPPPPVRQVVLLGAGTDSQTYRMDRPENTRLFESDTAAPLDFKTSVLRQERAVARCQRITVTADPPADWPAAAGHNPAAPTAWIAEELLIYLPKDTVELLRPRSARCRRQAAGCG